MKKTDAIIVLDGYGLNDEVKGNAIKAANTPYLDYLFKTYPNCRLSASGLDVGLPAGLMGNSEVGHLNLGAGRVVYQDITAIDNSIKDGSFFDNPALKKAMQNAKDKALHLCGLLSDGGVHSSINHLFALIKMAKDSGVKNVYIHCVTDGRDTPPQSAINFVAMLEKECVKTGAGKVATVVGRYYYMDRDNRWERVEQGYNCVFEGCGTHYKSAQEAVQACYDKGIKDEFLTPCIIGDYKGFNKGDSFVFFNFRADRAREITAAVTEPHFDKFKRNKGFLEPLYAGFTQYDDKLTRLYTVFPPKKIDNTLGEYLAKNKKTQARVAETEKYAHVTFFFNGGVEEPNEGESRFLIPSPKVATYDLQPEMSAYEVALKAAGVVGSTDVLIMNFANCDMVGHTGVYEAAIKAVETVDRCLKTVLEAVLKSGGTALVLSDHGNAETMSFKDGTPMTAHTTNLVPLILAGDKYKDSKLCDGKLCDVAVTFLNIIGLDIPKEMTGKNLIIN